MVNRGLPAVIDTYLIKKSIPKVSDADGNKQTTYTHKNFLVQSASNKITVLKLALIFQIEINEKLMTDKTDFAERQVYAKLRRKTVYSCVEWILNMRMKQLQAYRICFSCAY